MSRSRREAQMEALYGDRYPAVLVSQMGSRKRDRRKLLGERLEERYAPEEGYARGTLPSYQGGTLAKIQRQLAAGPFAGNPAGPAFMGRLMNLPLTAVGLGKAAMKGADFGLSPEGAITAEIEADPNFMDAQTMGDVIMMRKGMNPAVKDKVYEHELGHVRQGEMAGPFLPLAYLAGTGYAAARGKDPYYDNPFETTAPGLGKEERTARGRMNPAMTALLTR